MAKDISGKYESWKNKLLDLGKRNRLLNYRETKASTLQIVAPDCYSLWDMLVMSEKPIVFPYVNEFSEDEETDIISDVETNKSLQDTQKTLRNLRNRARTTIEEQGVNVLYLSFGFLNWTESDNSNYTFKSPLVLVPVTITIDSITSPYVLSLHEDEIVVNPTLTYKLSNDFGITLPGLNDDLSIKEYFKEIKKLLTLDGWSLEESVSLSLLSFLKINMYNDLDKHKETILSNRIIRNIAGDSSAVENVPENILDYDFDKNEKPIDVFQVVDADASQQDAILMAKNGVSFVLQGPPGTGKSQTITNIIAESLAAGKKVLFVSEKMAALDVVHRRLQSVELDDFCLVLHSYKANKRNVLDQLDRVLNLAEEKHSLSDLAYQKLIRLQTDKENLNEYCKEIFEPVLPLNKTIYEVNGIIANLSGVEDVLFAIDEIEKVSFEDYNRIINCITGLVSTLESSTKSYLSNPWKNSNKDSVTNEFRQDVNNKFSLLNNQLKIFDEDLNNRLNKLKIYNIHNYNDTLNIINVLGVVSHAKRIPVKWVTELNNESIREKIDEFKKLQSDYNEVYNSLKQVAEQIDSLNSDISLGKQNINDVKIANEEESIVLSLLNQKPFADWKNIDLETLNKVFNSVKEKVELINSTKNDLINTYEPSVFEIDYKTILNRFKTEYTSFTKAFKSQYRADKKEFIASKKEFVKKISDEEILTAIDSLKLIDESRKWIADNQQYINQMFVNGVDENIDINYYDNQLAVFKELLEYKNILFELIKILDCVKKQENDFKSVFDIFYSGIHTNSSMISDSFEWAIEFKDAINNTPIGIEFIETVCNSDTVSEKYQETKLYIENEINKFTHNYEWFKSLFDGSEEYDNLDYSEICRLLNDCKNNLSALESWIDLKNARNKCLELGLDDFIEKVCENDIKSENVIPIFKKRFFSLWLDKIIVNYPSVSNFRRTIQDKLVLDFDKLDKEQFDIAKARIRSQLINSLPSIDRLSNGVDELSILRKELKKKKRIMPIRKLFASIPNLLLTLKPCLMMSPLSVSLFLEAETYQFDIVIFDEASQVCTENAIGAISRGKQVVIAGDSKQLPPTSFFQTAISDGDFDVDDSDEYDDSDAYESILEEANALPERTLRWHYRSRHESLIAFSNAKIYRNNLVTFPSKYSNKSGYGVEYKYVPDACYDRGGKKGNIKEAEQVAEMVFNHIKDYPKRSLGVIAFGEVQQQIIDSVIRRKRVENPQYEYFFNEENEEPFFVKNLENVQGDERDTIIFSIGYAEDSNGTFHMNFGPLSKDGGERRLNVAITRAKYNVKLVGSIHAQQIDTEKITTEGPKLLRSYIEFAENGPEVLKREITENNTIEHDSPFEEAVFNYLDRKGYKLATQVGCSGYRIDMAVKHPTISGVYVLGIECDGASYHSARTARERDRLRQDVLENMGWKIYRIWSTDWIKDPITEGKRLINAVDEAIATFDSNDSISQKNKNEKHTSDEYLNTIQASENETNPYGFDGEIEYYNFLGLPRNSNGFLNIEDCIQLIVEKEYPVHYDIICQKLAPLLGNNKVTSKIRSEVDYGLKLVSKSIIRKDDFFYPRDYVKIPVHIPNERKINYISTDEIATAMETILKTCVGATPEMLCTETTRAFGFTRNGQNITIAMKKAVDQLIDSGKAKIIEGKIKLNQ